MDIALALEALVPGAEYFGSVSENTEAAYNALDWMDERTKPLWISLNTEALALAKSARIAALAAQCGAAIVAGFSSTALGSLHLYPMRPTDQVNMMGSVTASLLPNLPGTWMTPFWCQDEAGEWAFRDHTASEIQHAGIDGKLHVVACQITLASLAAQVDAATTEADIAAVTWPRAI
jgi:hypothetical protein